jgi:hypothetical protein
MKALYSALASLLDRMQAKDAALAIWGLTATFLNLALIKALAEANRRFNAFVAELARFNARFEAPPPRTGRSDKEEP